MEGKGDTTAVPKLAGRVLTLIGGNDALFVDDDPFRVKGIGTLIKDNCANWRRWLSDAGRTRRNIGGVLLLLDGDIDRVPKTWASYAQRYGSVDFCAYQVAAMLAHEALSSRAGDAFSLGVVFAMREFEAWLMAGVESLRGVMLAEERGSVPNNATAPEMDIEAKRNAKGELQKLIPGYDPSLDQAIMAAKVDLSVVAQRCRSFRRFQSAIGRLANAVRTRNAIVSPSLQ